MSELLLDSLEIKGYRCFEHLTIEKLGRVNLIVGKNNVGKTALLEALWVFVNRGDRKIINDVLYNRSEEPNLEHLFYGRPAFDETQPNNFFKIGIINNKDLFIKVERVTNYTTNTIYKILFRPQTYYVKTLGIQNTEIIQLWDRTALTEKEIYVMESLQLVLENITAIDLLVYPEGASNRIPVARISDSPNRIPLKSLGEGMSRIFGIILALVNCKDGIFIIDEVEIGLHYSVLPAVWKLIFKIAKDLNVQVFATTHSYDCIDAFTKAAIEDRESDGILIRLARQDTQIKAFTFDEKQLKTITKEHIEVR